MMLKGKKKKLFNKYNGEYGSLELNFTHENVNDAISWGLVAKDSKNDAKKFIGITRKILNELLDNERVNYDIKNVEKLNEELNNKLKDEELHGSMDVAITYDTNDHFMLHLDFDNNSTLQ